MVIDRVHRNGMSRIVKPKGSKAPSAKQAAFLAAYSKTGVVTVAAEMAGVHRRNHPFWLQNNKDYPASFNEADAMGRSPAAPNILRAHCCPSFSLFFYVGSYGQWNIASVRTRRLYKRHPGVVSPG